uniref:GATA-type domain-containing protein n=1 Tax=Meloidogyne enterolobii TaxID=390850 RepID=A0A6V7WUJ1_MELEN|nr:unnamed protein product [Meloidogyne enterolobii]
MNKFIIILFSYLVVLLNIQIKGKMVEVGLKIKEDWEEKREFIYLKNIQIKERFVLIMNVNQGNKIENYVNKKTESFCKIEIDPVEKVFIVNLNNCSKYISQLKTRILIEIANNEIVKKFLENLGKQIRLNNNFILNNNYYETSILEESLVNRNKKELLNENIENYKNKLLSSYWTEINLIGYKIELLDKQKVEYPKEGLKSKIIEIGNKIKITIEKKRRDCFNCGVKQNKASWNKYLKEHYLCHTCGNYNQKNGKHRHKSLFIKNKDDRKCFICGVNHTSQWYRYSIPGYSLCADCYNKQQRLKKSIKNTKIT